MSRLSKIAFGLIATIAGLPAVAVRSSDLLLLLSGVDLAQTRRRRWYERVA